GAEPPSLALRVVDPLRVLVLRRHLRGERLALDLDRLLHPHGDLEPDLAAVLVDDPRAANREVELPLARVDAGRLPVQRHLVGVAAAAALVQDDARALAAVAFAVEVPGALDLLTLVLA